MTLHRTLTYISAGLAVATALPACSTRAVYQTVQGWQQQECRRISDAAERQRCMDSTAGSYDDYRRAREAAQGKP